MGLALYRKYRPKGLNDVVGQTHIVTTLQNAIKSGKISHAYLLTGPKGVGKTSVARILAHELNGLPYTDDSMHLDIIEIDAASNRRIDEIRDLRDKVHIAPTSAKYKVYIIDEVHMLTREAFNALLKTLEEPPAHAIFILATTEAHKVPDTITSRTQRFNFKPITRQDTVEHLRHLAKQEKIKIADDALEALADHAGGSFRDSINLLDQMVGAGDTIQKEDVQTMLGLPNPAIVESLYNSLQSGDLVAISQNLTDAKVGGSNAGLLIKALGGYIRAKILESQQAPDKKLTTLLRQIINAANEKDAFASLELSLFEYCAVQTTPVQVERQTQVVTKAPKINTVQPKEAIEELPPEPTIQSTETAEITSSEQIENTIPQEAKSTNSAPVAEDAFWGELLQATKKSHNTLYGVLRMAKPELNDDVLTLNFNFGFHHKQMSQAANQKKIADFASELLGKPIKITSLHKKGTPEPTETQQIKSAPKEPPQKPTALTDVSSIFNGAELIE